MMRQRFKRNSVYNQQFYVPVSVVYPIYPTSIQDHQPKVTTASHVMVIPCNGTWQIYRDVEQIKRIKSSIERMKAPVFLEIV